MNNLLRTYTLKIIIIQNGLPWKLCDFTFHMKKLSFGVAGLVKLAANLLQAFATEFSENSKLGMIRNVYSFIWRLFSNMAAILKLSISGYKRNKR